MKIKTSELTGAALDWAVAQIERLPGVMVFGGEISYQRFADRRDYFRPSEDWSEGGRIIDRIDCIASFELKCGLESKPGSRCEVHIRNNEGDWIAFGPTLLIAAMRCYVASELGDEVDIPEELAS